MAKKDTFEWLDNTGSNEYKRNDENAFRDNIEKKIERYLKQVQKAARKYKLIDKGNLVSEKGYRVERTDIDKITMLQIFMINYGLYQDKGVQGVKDSSNAPNSPYKFKTLGMPESAIESLSKSIKSGKKKVRNVQYEKVGLETKASDSEGDVMSQARSMAYMIKSYGIKTKPFFTEVFEKNFGKLTESDKEALKKSLVATLIKQNRK